MSNVEVKVTPNGQDLVIREGQASKIYQYEGFQHKAFSTESFIALVKAKGSQQNAVVAYADNGIRAILDDTVQDRDQDTIDYSFRNSQQFEEWKGILNGAKMLIPDFVKFLKRRDPAEIDGYEAILAAMQNFKFVTNISGDFTYDDRNNYTFAMKIGEAEGTVKLPQILNIEIELFNESGFVQCLEVELEVIVPRNESEKVMLNLSCPKLSRYLREAVNFEIDKVKKDLDGWLIVTGAI